MVFNMEESVKIKPCPFCGNEDLVLERVDSDLSRFGFNQVVCPTCESKGPKGKHAVSVIDLWNKVSNPK